MSGVLQKRAAGILLAASSLPSRHGIGAFGAAARDWLGFLRDAGQSYWQLLPLGPTGWGDSPYMSFSAFALSPYYVDLDELVDKGLLQAAEIAPTAVAVGVVDYAALFRNREPLLRRAFERFRADKAAFRDFEAFCAENAAWIADYALFMALKAAHGGKSWTEWEEPLRFRDEKALFRFHAEHSIDVDYHSFVQYLAFSQWRRLKDHAAGLGVAIIGDMSIYVALDSADTWAKPELFQLDDHRRPLRVAGCPPDPFAAGGQLWGNPLYRWDYHEKTGFDWWLSRLRAGLSLYDVVRIDHFRGFESYFSIPADASDAKGGEWVKGPGLSFVKAVNTALPGAGIIAEDLGYLTDEVRALLAASGYPGMKVLQFAFDSRESSDYMPYTYPRNCVVYTGTHDNDTTAGWFKSAPREDAAFARDYLGLGADFENAAGTASDAMYIEAFIRAALGSVAQTAIIPMQDYLALGSEARMNTPSTTGSNWQWRMIPGAASPELAAHVKKLTRLNGRL
jgi:4-alpha-glucanotransferase